ncbi:MAG: hypothetical protein MAG453_00753 [Calditrichaeota bacterium]|nr:hypothetical protein [Calditrichota bacterium]
MIARPNPFNAVTTIGIALPVAGEVEVVVYNVNGREVAELADGSFPAGRHAFTFDATGLASGIYLVRTVVAGELDEMTKLMLVR